MDEDARAALQPLLESWDALAQEARARSRASHTGDAQAAYYYKGVLDTLQRVIGDVQALLGEAGAPAAAQESYAPVTEAAVEALLSRVGLYPRALRVHDDYVVTAVFSKLQPLWQDRRLHLLAEIDSAIVVIDHGRLPDTGDPFIDFAFRLPTPPTGG